MAAHRVKTPSFHVLPSSLHLLFSSHLHTTSPSLHPFSLPLCFSVLYSSSPPSSPPSTNDHLPCFPHMHTHTSQMFWRGTHNGGGVCHGERFKGMLSPTEVCSQLEAMVDHSCLRGSDRQFFCFSPRIHNSFLVRSFCLKLCMVYVHVELHLLVVSKVSSAK